MADNSSIRFHFINYEPLVNKFSICYITFGVVSLLLNLFIVIVIVVNRRTLLNNIFFILWINFSVVDMLRSTCLISWFFHSLYSKSFQDSNALHHIRKVIEQLHRTCSIAVILNILLVTLNEAFYTQKPFVYERVVTSGKACLALVILWGVSIGYTVARQSISWSEQRQMDDQCGGDVYNSTCGAGNDHAIETAMSITSAVFGLMCLLIILVVYTITCRMVRRILLEDTVYGIETDQGDTLRSSRNRTLKRSSRKQRRAQAREHIERKKQVLKRNRYIFVIGLVIFCYSLYLIAFIALKVLWFLTVTKDLIKSDMMVIFLHFAINLIFGIHTVVQPLCLFRMKELRVLACKTVKSLLCFDMKIPGRREWSMMGTATT